MERSASSGYEDLADFLKTPIDSFTGKARQVGEEKGSEV